MDHALKRLHLHAATWHHVWAEVILSILIVIFILIAPASATMRFQDRSLYMSSSVPGATASYTISFRYMSPEMIGSVDLLFCNDPIPHHACVTPAGLDVSQAVLTEQSGETGYSIATKTTNHIVLSRPPDAITSASSSYTFDNIKNPTDTSQAFSIRLRSHTSLDASGSQVDFGSIRGQVTDGIVIETQVPPMLIFCVAQEVEQNCTSTNETYYADLGQLDAGSTLTTQSQMAIGTNASSGFAITANGSTMSAGTNIIDASPRPTQSKVGFNQFGINLVENTLPRVGKDPEGPWTEANPAAEYSMPDYYKYVPGDVVASSPNVSLMRKFTVSYIVNSNQNLPPGVYSTTLNYIASGRF
jgi:hypothetical protein